MGSHFQYLTESLSEAADRFAALEAQHEKDAKGLHTCVNTMQEKVGYLPLNSMYLWVVKLIFGSCNMCRLSMLLLLLYSSDSPLTKLRA